MSAFTYTNGVDGTEEWSFFPASIHQWDVFWRCFKSRGAIRYAAIFLLFDMSNYTYIK